MKRLPLWFALLLPCLATADISAQNPRNVIPPPGATTVKTLLQNWTNAESETFYNVPQGSKLLPYRWFLALEQAGSNVRFLDVANIQKLGYIARTPGPGNTDGLPVGFAKDDKHVGLTCAACHTQQIVVGDKSLLIDGAPTLADYETFQKSLAAALKDTVNVADKFKIFADRVLGVAATEGQRMELMTELKVTLAVRESYNARNLSRNPALKYGPGRVDAFGAILNQVSSVAGKLPDNHFVADAPVSYPFLWDTPQHDFVQWNGAAPNNVNELGELIFGTKHIGALGRNAGEVLGVFGTFDVKNDIILPKGYPSSANLPNLIKIEDSIRTLWSPQWPVAELGPINDALRASGETLFNQHCATCHKSIERTNPNREVKAWLESSVGTDPTMASHFLTRVAKTGDFEGQYINVPGLRKFKESANQSQLLVHSVQRVLIGGGAGATFAVPFQLAGSAEVTIGDQKLTGRFQSLELQNEKFLEGILDRKSDLKNLKVTVGKKTFTFANSVEAFNRFQSLDGESVHVESISNESVLGEAGSRLKLKKAAPVGYIYKGRPLNGIWATAPYLHNGSVPNIDELLKKPTARTKTFQVGSRVYDKENMGFVSTAGTFLYDTNQPGNSNAGHDYGDTEFSADQRKALIEYLKSL